MLFGKTVRSRILRGRIKAITFDPDYDWSRVLIADYHDITGENYVALIADVRPTEHYRRTVTGNALAKILRRLM